MILQFMRWAARNHHHSSSKYTEVDFNLKQVGQDDNIVFLTVDEVVRMHNLKFRPDQVQLEQARDCYLFQCFSGLRYSDLARVKRNNINNDFLTLISQKTGSKTKIPLHRVALSILHKYEHLPDVSPLPVVSQVKYNQHLKTLGFMAKLNDPVTVVGYSGNKRNETTVKKWEILSTHTARKTFISLAIFLGMTVEEVASITGHKSDSIKRYYTIQDQQKRESIKRLDSIKLKVV